MTYIGIDVGSTYVKYCIMNCTGQISKTFCEQTPIRQEDYFLQKIKMLEKKYGNIEVVSCGYGRKNVHGLKCISELTALGYGAYKIYPQDSVILDIGGQDTKIISQKSGKIKEFFVNEKCAAGCGMFLKTTLDMLGMSLNDIDLSEYDETKTNLKLSTVCAVFAQSEIVQAIAENKSEKDIIFAVLYQILCQAKALLNKVNCDKVILSGGLTQIKNFDLYAQKILNKETIITDHSRYLSAIGCSQILYKNECERNKI